MAASSSKYRNVRQVTTDGKFDSKKELARWQELQLLLRAGLIRDLRRQVTYELLPPVQFHDSPRPGRCLRYVADFVYFDVEKAREVIEDTKGMRTDVYVIKRHMMKALLGLDIHEYSPRQ